MLDYLELQWNDNAKARLMLPDGNYKKIKKTPQVNAQESLIHAAKKEWKE